VKGCTGVIIFMMRTILGLLRESEEICDEKECRFRVAQRVEMEKIER